MIQVTAVDTEYILNILSNLLVVQVIHSPSIIEEMHFAAKL